MKGKNQIDFEVLREEAENSEHQESYRVLERSRNYRIGVGARLTRCSCPSFFIEVLVYPCPDNAVDLLSLERTLMFLRELQKRGYFLNCQDHNCISCETTPSPKNLALEVKDVKSIIRRTLQITA